ncbi:MFS transporter [Marivita sp. XM-24bin2]|uniref:MFS transporter n=1 Tax=unclassified Marivita TaxID=2632480 RepID=UPI0025C2A234|nr:MFS transporter [Marivita sp. XM-24bin2]MCR9108214.1 MFS transporter [Paracoccaceae bacterium]
MLFWQATWFLFLQDTLSASEAVLLYAVYDIGTTVFEVPSGYMSDKVGRRITLTLSAIAGLAAMVCFSLGDSFAAFALAQILLGASIAFASGTDSSLLYETLAAEGRQDEVEAFELRLWRFTFAALMVSAVTGGLLARVAPVLPFVLSGLAFVVMLLLALRLRDGPHQVDDVTAEPVGKAIAAAFQKPVLLWLFALSVVMYGFSHVPFVFGQPFILRALESVGLSGEAPLVSGVVTSIMMAVSVAASFAAPQIRQRFGLAPTLLLAFGLQIGLCAVLALNQSLLAIAILFLRMVPDSLSRPFILATTQPLLTDGMRATYLSIQSFVGRIAFATSLWLASRNVSDVGEMPVADLSRVLTAYAGFGAVILSVLWLAARHVDLEPSFKSDKAGPP